MPIKKEKLDALQQRMDKLKITDNDLVEKFILGSGKGGRKSTKPIPVSTSNTSLQELRSNAARIAPAR